MQTKRLSGLVTAGVLAGFTFVGPAGAAVFGDFNPVRHDRFVGGNTAVDNPGYLLGGFDLSGVGIGFNGGVAITPLHVVAASHFAGSSHTFRANDGSTVTRNVAARQRLFTGAQESDIEIIRLDSPLPSTVVPLPVVTGTAGQFINSTLFLYDQNNRTGASPILSIQEASFGGPTPFPTLNAVTFYSPNDTGNPDRAGLVPGDSGHGALFVAGDTLAVFGTHFGISTSTPTQQTEYFSLSSFFSPYLSQAQQFTQQSGFTIATVPVPEPGSAFLLAGGVLFLLRRRAA